MKITELKEFTPQQFTELSELMTELSERLTLTEEAVQNVMKDENSHLYVLTDENRIIGCATLGVFHSPTGRKANIEDVVVSTSYRGQRLGRRLMEHVLQMAQKMAPIEVHLTSKPKRVAANKLYQALGFERKETNFYRLTINVD
ncbi:acetyltransferase, GNAT family [gut metagenome]|uniref:Acetyltransferase, GNAT family n=1 Tax=gut metagenome TaxID=749906 RepID=J9GVA3_9ZZZZ